MSRYKKNVPSKKSTIFDSDFDEFGEYKGEWVFHEKESEDLIDPIDVYRMSEDRDDEYTYDSYNNCNGHNDGEANTASFSFQRFREDEELFVDDQSCRNCACRGSDSCPMRLKSSMPKNEREAVKASRREDAEFRNGRLFWCIYWKGNPNRNSRERRRQY